jgi:hypothetical protein
MRSPGSAFWLRGTRARLAPLVGELDRLLFGDQAGRRASGILSAAAILALYVLGVRHWVSFFNYGRLAFNAIDWPKEYLHYSILQQALVERPPHMRRTPRPGRSLSRHPRDGAVPATGAADNPGPGTSPRSTPCLGSVGSWHAPNQRRASAAARRVHGDVPARQLNGHIVSHLAAGYRMWNGYFLPFLCLYSLEMIEERRSWTATASALALVPFGMVPQARGPGGVRRRLRSCSGCSGGSTKAATTALGLALLGRPAGCRPRPSLRGSARSSPRPIRRSTTWLRASSP